MRWPGQEEAGRRRDRGAVRGVQAAIRTAAASYRIGATEKILKTGGLRSQPWATASGMFDPAQRVGERTDDQGAQVRYVGAYMYVFVTDDLRAASHVMKGTPIPDWASRERLPSSLNAATSTAGPAMLGTFPVLLGQVDPQDLPALLKSATRVREAGPASGPGWTGTAYAYSAATRLSAGPCA